MRHPIREEAAVTAKSWEGQERRRYRRVPVSYQIELLEIPVNLEVGGDDCSIQRFTVEGVTVNVSRSGVLARVDRVLVPGTHCVVRFLVGEGEIGPEIMGGTVLRAEKKKQKGFILAIEFDSPLEVLNVTGERRSATGSTR